MSSGRQTKHGKVVPFGARTDHAGKSDDDDNVNNDDDL